MARIRAVKAEFFTDEDVAELPPLVRLLFIGMWCHADKAGRMKDKPKTIKCQCLPHDKIDVESALNQLADAKFIYRYRVDGANIIQIRTWDEHQKPHHTERDSKLPSFTPLKDGDLTESMFHAPSPTPTPTPTPTPSTRKERLPLPPSLEGCPEFVEAWDNWVAHRKEIRKPLTKTSTKQQLKQFEEWGAARSVAAITYTIRKGWQGIREDESKSNGNGKISVEEIEAASERYAQENGLK